MLLLENSEMPGTNAVLTFRGAGADGRSVHVYDNCDACPTGAAEKLVRASLAASSFGEIADAYAIGDVPGSLEMRVIAENWRRTCGTNYRYIISRRGGEPYVRGYCPDFSELPDDFRLKPGRNFPRWREIFHGTLPEFIVWARQDELARMES